MSSCKHQRNIQIMTTLPSKSSKDFRTCKFPRNLSSLNPLASIKIPTRTKNKKLIERSILSEGKFPHHNSDHRGYDEKNYVSFLLKRTHTYRPVSCCWKSSCWFFTDFFLKTQNLTQGTFSELHNWRPQCNMGSNQTAHDVLELSTADTLYCWRLQSSPGSSQLSVRVDSRNNVERRSIAEETYSKISSTL